MRNVRLLSHWLSPLHKCAIPPKVPPCTNAPPLHHICHPTPSTHTKCLAPVQQYGSKIIVLKILVVRCPLGRSNKRCYMGAEPSMRGGGGLDCELWAGIAPTVPYGAAISLFFVLFLLEQTMVRTNLRGILRNTRGNSPAEVWRGL